MKSLTKARIVVIGDRRVLDDGARVAAVKLDLISASPDADLSKEERAPVFIDLGHLDPAGASTATPPSSHRSREAPRQPKAAGLR